MFKEKSKRARICLKKRYMFIRRKLKTRWQIFKAFKQLTFTPHRDFPDLAPNENAELVQDYVERLDELIFSRAEKVKEIAVTAPFSGGKSSFLRTYMKQRPSLLIEVISLAAFKDENQNAIASEDGDQETESNGSEINTTSRENKIEKSILQQLLYRTSSNKATYSRFRRIFPQPLGSVRATLLSCWLLTIVASLYLLLGGQINLNDVIQTLLRYDAFSWKRYLSFEFIFIVSTISLPILVLKDVIKFSRSYSLTKLNPLKGEFAFSEKSNDSVFNKYLEEIIYYFAVQETDIVVFEDLDRFGSTDIFVSLKELNKLINDSLDVKQPVRFIYALKDDVFKGKTRTKFFDSIIPIVPYASSSNSYPQLKKLLKRCGFDSELGDELIRDVSVFLDDMRMINNIVAEYGIYKDVLKRSSEKRDPEKVFAFVVYKNNYSDDFALLNENAGKLADFFKSIQEFKDSARKKIAEEVKRLEDQIKEIENEKIESEEELISLCFKKVFDQYYNTQQKRVSQIIQSLDISDLFRYETFMKLYESDKKYSFPPSQTNNFNQNMSFKDYILAIFPDFEKRLVLIRDKTSGKRQTLETKITERKREDSKIYQDSIFELCEVYGRDFIFEAFELDEEFKKEKFNLLIHMIEKGYIDQHYDLYIYHHRDGILTSEDMAYLRVVKRDEKVLADYLPTNISEFIKYFDNHDYSQKAFFNTEIINYLLLKTNGENIVRLHFNSAYEDESELLSLFINYRDKFQEPQRIAWIIFTEVESFITKAFSSNTIDAHISVFINDLVMYSCKSDLQFIEEKSLLSKYISANQSFITYVSQYEQPHVYLRKLKELDVHFENLDNSKHLKNEMKRILKDKLFQLNYPNFSALLTVCFGIEQDNDGALILDDLFNIENDTVKRILENEDEFLANCVINRQLIVNTEKVFAKLLNSDEIELEIKKLLIKTIAVDISDLVNIKYSDSKETDYFEDIVRSLIAEQKLAFNCTVQIALLGNKVEVGESYLAGYFDKAIERNSLCKDLELSNIERLVSILFNNEAASYAEKVIDLFKLEFDEFLINLAPVESLSKYIKTDRVDMSVSNYRLLYSHDEHLAYKLLNKHYEAADFSSEGINFTEDDFYEVMGGDFSTDFKKFLLENYGHLLSEKEDNEAIAEWVLKFTKDSNKKIKIGYEILKLLIQSISSKEVEVRIELFLQQLGNLDSEEVIALLPYINEDIYRAIVDNKRPVVNQTPVMKRMLDLLQEHNFISSYTKVFGGFRVIPKKK
ncbi:MAG: hypothetical protein CL582_08280 [Alteromonadaceae bacterium]|nr:hypothetical protein [Alteromonadaceae bacterium]|tara:strand:- start:2725 stop:6501 length:3777 start_codon:yes stop_codon:yes gene_type:complete